MSRLFTQHPRSVNETYLEHGLRAVQYSFKLSKASIACFLHACFPFIFENYASKTIKEIQESIAQRQTKTNK